MPEHSQHSEKDTRISTAKTPLPAQSLCTSLSGITDFYTPHFTWERSHRDSGPPRLPLGIQSLLPSYRPGRVLSGQSLLNCDSLSPLSD